MGCKFSRESVKVTEESSIKSAEALLHFDTIDCSDIDMSFSRYAIDNQLTENQLIASMESLGIPGENLKEFPYSFYFKYCLEEHSYSLKKLVCVGILLGKGNPAQKGELLFRNYDRDCSGEMDMDEFKTMIDDMILISFVAGIELAKQNDRVMFNALDNYLKKLKETQKIFYIYVHFIMSMGKENKIISLENFIATFNDVKMQMIATTSGIRKLALNLYEMQSREIRH